MFMHYVATIAANMCYNVVTTATDISLPLIHKFGEHTQMPLKEAIPVTRCMGESNATGCNEHQQDLYYV